MTNPPPSLPLLKFVAPDISNFILDYLSIYRKKCPYLQNYFPPKKINTVRNFITFSIVFTYKNG